MHVAFRRDAEPGTLAARSTLSSSVLTVAITITLDSLEEKGSAPFEGAGAGFQPEPSPPATHFLPFRSAARTLQDSRL
jgi:hypothetical protein